MRKLIQFLLILLPFVVFSQEPRVFTGQCDISQTGSGSGYWALSISQFNDPLGLYDATEIQAGDFILFNDGGIEYKLAITLVVSASGSSATVRVSNVGVTGIGSVPTAQNVVLTRGTANYGFIPFVANISDNNQQGNQEYNMYRVDSILAIKDSADVIPLNPDIDFGGVLASNVQEALEAVQDALPFRPSTTTEVAASDISTGTKQALGFTVQFKSGKIGLIYPDGGTAGARGDIAMRTSEDGGGSFSTEVDIIADTLIDYEAIGGGVTETGRLIVSYEKKVFATNQHIGVYRKYSDDEGVTWSSELQITDSLELAYGGVISIGNNDVLLPFYQPYTTITPNRVAGTYVCLSIDNGLTFGSPILVLSGADKSEASYTYLGGGYIVGLVRQNNGSTFRQVISDDNGATWTDSGNTTFETWTAGINVESPAWLTTFRRTGGKKMVAAYYINRETKKMRVVFANSEDIISSGVTAWQTRSLKTIKTATASSQSGCGYPSAIQPHDSPYAFGWFYDTNTGLSTTKISFFTTTSLYDYPSNRILYGTGTDPTTSNLLTYNPADTSLTINRVKVWGGRYHKDESVAVGENTLSLNTTGVENTAMGFEALKKNTTGSGNTAYGRVALTENTTGYSNTALGVAALRVNTTGYQNVAAGEAALRFNTTGFNNTAIGKNALYQNTTGWGNIAVGLNAGYNGVEKKNTIYIGHNPSVANPGLVDSSAQIGRAMKWVRLGDNYKFNTDQTVGVGQEGYVQTYNNSSGEIELQPNGLTGYTVATLPVSPTIGDMAYVTDALTPTYLGILVGGGAVVTPVFYNGTAWVSH